MNAAPTPRGPDEGDPATEAKVNETEREGRPVSIRYMVGLALVWIGPLLAAAAASTTLVQYGHLREVPTAVVALGYVLYLAGWLTLPATVGRRVLAAVLGFVGLLIYLHTFPGIFEGLQTAFGLVGGPFGSTSMGAFAQAIAVTLVLAGWLIVRSRKALAYVVLPAAFVVQLVLALMAFGGGSPFTWPVPFSRLFTQLSGPIVVVGMAGVLVGWALIVAGSAWGAAALDRIQRARAARPRSRPGESSGETSNGTNVFAILALVFGIGGGVLGIVFGHIARAQIRRTAERGWGLATAGLVLGYIGLAATVGVVLVYIVAILIVQGQLL
jgi:hypothetical protein